MKRVRDGGPPTVTEKDKYLSNCTYCGWGIFTNHNYKWVGCDGLVHEECIKTKNEIK
jgi:hypothetical protein